MPDEPWNDEPEEPEEPERDTCSERDTGSERAPGGTQRENAYLKELVQNQSPVVVKLRSGEEISGYIEYYDKNMLRITREGAPNLFIFKHEIKYLQEAPSGRRPGHRARA